MKPKIIKEQIIEILKNGVFKGKLFEGQCEFLAEDIERLFQADREEMMKMLEGEKKNLKEIEERVGTFPDNFELYGAEGFNQAIDIACKILKGE